VTAKQRETDGGQAATVYTVRVCRWCGARFAWPKGSRRPGCPRCQLSIEQEGANHA